MSGISKNSRISSNNDYNRFTVESSDQQNKLLLVKESGAFDEEKIGSNEQGDTLILENLE